MHMLSLCWVCMIPEGILDTVVGHPEHLAESLLPLPDHNTAPCTSRQKHQTLFSLETEFQQDPIPNRQRQMPLRSFSLQRFEPAAGLIQCCASGSPEMHAVLTVE